MAGEADSPPETAATTGRDEVLEELFVHQRARLHRLCRGLLADERDAEDAVQEAFVRAAPRLHTADDPTAYLVVTARNVCFEELRRRRIRGDAHALAPAAQVSDPEASAVDLDTVSRALRVISRDDREVLSAAAAGFSLTETARRLGTTVDAAAQRLSRARRRARQAIASLPAAVFLPRFGALREWAERLHQMEAATAPLVVAVIAGAAAVTPAAAPTANAPTHSAAPVQHARDAGAAAPAGHDQAATSSTTRAGTLPATAGKAAAAAPATQQNTTTTPGDPTTRAESTSFTASPSYDSDHTLFASTAPTVSPCPTTTCATLLRSTDSGRTWSVAGSFGGGVLLLPGPFPQSHTIFAVNAGGLEQSDNAGASFRRVLPFTESPGSGFAPTAVVDEASGHVVVATSPTSLMTYDAATGQASAGPMLPATAQRIDALLAAPGGGVYVDVRALDGGGMFQCASGCTKVGPWVPGSPLLSPTFAADHTLFSATGNGVLVARIDGGDSRNLALADPVERLLPARDWAGSGRLDVVALHRLDDGSIQPQFLESVGGGPLQPTGARLSAVPLDPATLTLLPDGELIAGLQAHGGPDGPYGIAHSGDGGVSWTRAT